MLRKTWIYIISALVVVAAIIVTVFLVVHKKSSSPVLEPTASASNTPSSTPDATASPVRTDVVLPIKDFYARITKKPFGIYITPQTSPVQPERFTGYHTGTDIEYTDTSGDVQVYAIAGGVVLQSQTASGYGGVMVFRFTVDNKPVVALYGHLRATSMLPAGSKVTVGEQVAVLGTGFSTETDGERRHLHFSIRADNTVSLLGYVQNKADLSGWIDPAEFLHSLSL